MLTRRWLMLLMLGTAAANAADTAPAAPANAALSARALYRVEVVIFRNNAAPPAGEDYNAPPEGRGFELNTRSPGAPPAVVRLLDPADLRMTSVARQLAGNMGTTLLAHAGWIQTPSVYRHHVGLPLEQLGINVPGLSGAIFLERGELLHVGAQLQWTSGGATYTLSELRDRVRFNERHYLDHPAFGAIIEVSQVKAQ
jgi:hypothetical protein